MMTKMTTTKKNKDIEGLSLIDLVFSWSIPVMNKNLFRDKVQQIPQTFSSAGQYLKSFVWPLIEETHADLFSSMTTLARAPICEVFDVKISKDFKPRKRLLYSIWFKGMNENENGKEIYTPEFGDLLALTDIRPKCIDDLNRPKRSYILALIEGVKNEDSYKLPVRSSKPIEFDQEDEEEGEKGDKLFAVYLTNLTTNMRIWDALHATEGANMKIIRTVLNPSVEESCTLCSNERSKEDYLFHNQQRPSTLFGLDDSQESAVLNCIATKECYHRNTIKLIWGPPGTGKTKTVASLLFTLSKMKCGTLTCAPTNIAVLGVINRLMQLVRPTLNSDTYGLGDIILFGNGERMKIDDYEELVDVFLDYRVSHLEICFAPLTGCKGSVKSVIQLLQDSDNQCQLYLNKDKKIEEKEDDEDDKKVEGIFMNMNFNNNQDEAESSNNHGSERTKKKAFWRKVIDQTVKENKKKSSGEKHKNSPKMKCNEEGKKFADTEKQEREESKASENLWTFEEFFMRKFNSVGKRLLICIIGLYTHLPTSMIHAEVVIRMVRALDLLQSLGTLFHSIAAANEGWFREVLCGIETKKKLR